MNLNAYDNIIEKIDKDKTWVDIKRKTIFSREISYQPYTCLLKRYNVKTNSNTYYIAMLKTPPEGKKYRHTVCDDYGRIKINVASIWKETYLPRLKNNCNIVCNLIENDDDGDVYFLDV